MKTLTYVIPVYNEEKRLNKTFNALLKSPIFDEITLREVIFVNDGSTDFTLSILENLKSKIEMDLNVVVKIISYDTNMGKGYAVKKGMLLSTSDYTLFFDADMSTPLDELYKFIPYFKRGDDVVIGTRKNGESTVKKHQPIVREYMGKCFTLISQVLLNTWVTDFTCGFKAFSYESKSAIFGRSMINRWGYDSEILFLAKKLGYKINERAVYWYNDADTKVNLFKAVISSFSEILEIRSNHFTGKYNFGFGRFGSKCEFVSAA